MSDNGHDMHHNNNDNNDKNNNNNRINAGVNIVITLKEEVLR